MSSFSKWRRTHSCGALTARDVGMEVVLNGWVHNWRNHGGIIFIDIRDLNGVTQVVFNPADDPETAATAATFRHEYVVGVKGNVRLRPANMANPRMATGEIEVVAIEAVLFNDSVTPPFHINDPDPSESEEIRLRYRYLDMRRPFLSGNISFRHLVTKEVRKFLWDRQFMEIETPILMKSTPEGARDFLVPSRLNRGKFYALPQSPQTYKQILMVAGFEKYFQIARCFRDEDLRADRQPEFTQIDVEMSFIDESDIHTLFEGMMVSLFESCLNRTISAPFRKMSHAEAFHTYGTDKPDLRFGLPIIDVGRLFKESAFNVFRSNLDSGGYISAIVVPGGGDLSRRQIDTLTAHVAKYGAKGLVWLRSTEMGLEGPTRKFLNDDEAANLISAASVNRGDMIFIIAAAESICFTARATAKRNRANEKSNRIR